MFLKFCKEKKDRILDAKAPVFSMLKNSMTSERTEVTKDYEKVNVLEFIQIMVNHKYELLENINE